MARTDREVGKRADMYRFDPEDLVIPGEGQGLLVDAESNAAPVNEGLVKNIMALGVIEPIEFARKEGEVIVINGRSRVKAAVEANKRLVKMGAEPITVPGVPYRGTENDLYGLMVSANEFRRDVTPMERARKSAKLLNMGKTEEQVAVHFGVDPQTIKNWQKILECCSRVQKAVESGQIKAMAAAQLSGLDKKEQGEKLDALLDATTGKPTVRKAAKLAKKEKQELLFPKPTRDEIKAEILDKSTPKQVREALLWAAGQGERTWGPKVSTEAAGS